MPRPKYRITEEDYLHATGFLTRQVLNYGIDFHELAKAQQEYWKAIDRKKKSRKNQAEQLNAWAETHLTSADWMKLKDAIRKRRERSARDQKTVTISEKAHQLLSLVAERDEVTYSEVLEDYLAKALRSRRDSPKASRRRIR